MQATALNIANMVGIGPFITIPGFLAAMHGPQKGWVRVSAGVVISCFLGATTCGVCLTYGLGHTF